MINTRTTTVGESGFDSDIEDNDYDSILGLGSNYYSASGFPFMPDPGGPSGGGGGSNFGQGNGMV